MEQYIDLHTHSSESDGTMSPSELVKYAKQKNLHAIAITDHDTISGVREAIKAGLELGVEILPGVEIGVEYEKEMHILGYFKKENYKNIEPMLENLIKNREERNPKIIKKLQELGINITLEEVIHETVGMISGRPHIAQVLIKKGYVKSMNDAFEKYLGVGKPAYFKKDKLLPEDAIKEINKAGGIAVLAHPIHLGISNDELNKLLKRLVDAGLKGIEAIYSNNTGTDTGNLLRMAIEHKIIPTGGSDFHGKNKLDIDIGTGRGNLKVSKTILDNLYKSFC